MYCTHILMFLCTYVYGDENKDIVLYRWQIKSLVFGLFYI